MDRPSDVVRVVSLCAGIGCTDLALGLVLGRRARGILHVEREASAAFVLATAMAEGRMDPAPIWSDIRTLRAGQWRGAVDCVVAGFPCTDVSNAGRREGIGGKHSGLWYEVLRCIRDMGPRIVVLENVSALIVRGFGEVLGGLAALGYDAEWTVLRASDVGAPHWRERIFILAYRDGDGFAREWLGGLRDGGGASQRDDSHRRGSSEMEHAASPGRTRGGGEIV